MQDFLTDAGLRQGAAVDEVAWPSRDPQWGVQEIADRAKLQVFGCYVGTI